MATSLTTQIADI